MSETDTKIHLVTNFEELPKTPQATWWDWVKYYCFNAYRKPMVWKKQKELAHIFSFVKNELGTKILPVLWDRKSSCPECRDAYMALKPQVFLSQIESLLKSFSKDHDHAHWMMFDSFLNAHQYAFDKSEEISRWINGFSK